jgi:hypothetical protein
MLCCVASIELASSTAPLEQQRSGFAEIWAVENCQEMDQWIEV